jgi:hypothetical protein
MLGVAANQQVSGYGRCQSFAELATTLAVSYLSLWRLAEEGKIKTIYIGARRVVPPDEIQRILCVGLPNPRSRRAAKADKTKPSNTLAKADVAQR